MDERIGFYQSCGTCVCVVVVWVGSLEQDLEEWGGVMSV